jgi:acyl-CoA thioester hydrolase
MMTHPSFKHAITVQPNDIDELGHVNNVVYIRWVQDVAAAHWQHVGTTDLFQKYLWVVLRHEIDYRNPSFLNDRIIGSTWVGEHHGARFERFVKLVREHDNKVLAEAKTIWCMLDAKTMRPVRIGQDVLDVLPR